MTNTIYFINCNGTNTHTDQQLHKTLRLLDRIGLGAHSVKACILHATIILLYRPNSSRTNPTGEETSRYVIFQCGLFFMGLKNSSDIFCAPESSLALNGWSPAELHGRNHSGQDRALHACRQAYKILASYQF